MRVEDIFYLVLSPSESFVSLESFTLAFLFDFALLGIFLYADKTLRYRFQRVRIYLLAAVDQFLKVVDTLFDSHGLGKYAVRKIILSHY